MLNKLIKLVHKLYSQIYGQRSAKALFKPLMLWLKVILLSYSFVLLSACDPFEEIPSIFGSPFQTFSQNKSIRISSKPIWDRLRNNYEFSPKKYGVVAEKAIRKHTLRYQKNEESLTKVSELATPYLYYIVEQLEKRNMPGELALLPMLESDFRPQATSHKGAAGLWQFIPSTGRMYGLKQNAVYDGRRDIKASTKAALDYLESLYETFDHDWHLALAAYNAGEGTVRRAIKQNMRAGKPTHYWDLKLPKETREYVPKLLALANIIGEPEKHEITLHPIANEPYFVPVYPQKPLHFEQVAKMAEINLSELKLLNAGYRKTITHINGAPQELLLPVANAKKFQYNLKKQ